MAHSSKKTGVKESDRLHLLQHALEHAAHLLPAQGPITMFVHHNTLHAFEEKNFHEAVREAKDIYDCEPYLHEDQYREKLSQRKILREDLEHALEEIVTEDCVIPGLKGETRRQLRLSMLSHTLVEGTPEQIHWILHETELLRRFDASISAEAEERLTMDAHRWLSHVACQSAYSSADMPADAQIFQELKEESKGLFDWEDMDSWSEREWTEWTLKLVWKIMTVWVGKTERVKSSHSAKSDQRPRHTISAESNARINEILIPLCAAYIDQGLSHWQLPEREKGLFHAFEVLYRKKSPGSPKWLSDVSEELERIRKNSLSLEQTMMDSMESLGIPEAEWEAFLASTALELKGWAGMIHQIESRPDKVFHPISQGSLLEYLAIRLILKKAIAGETKSQPDQLLKKDSSSIQKAFLMFQVARFRGWEPSTLLKLKIDEWLRLIEEVTGFDSLARRQVFHLAYERRYRMETLDAIHHRAIAPWKAGSPKTEFQVVCCIDDREESFRRGLEEKYPEAETFGAAGFFSIPMYYRAITDAHYTPLCPPVVRPQHFVQETAAAGRSDDHEKFQKIRNWIGSANHRLHLGAQGLLGGMVTGFLGAVATAPLVAGVMAPRNIARLRKLAHSIVARQPDTDVVFERKSEEPGTTPDQLGFTTVEMANMVERMLTDIGLTTRFAPVIAIVGHGSSSMNNPHKAAYDCGACGGAKGGPNARVFAMMANDARVRKLLLSRGIDIPDTVWFLGGYHNTCDDSMTYFDLGRVPVSHRNQVEKVIGALDDARAYNALERCRRFRSAPLGLTEKKAVEHVEARSEHLAQPRPECGHATNAACYVGRRSRLRGLFMDRRAFLTSYDPTRDAPGAPVLTRILQAVVPVCGGINLEYYFSYTDPSGWGCGTKLPHNVTSMLGVMDGAGSDLRTGLPWQMVELHESLRILFIVEASVQTLESILESDPNIRRMVQNEWTQLAALDPHSEKIHYYNKGVFELHQPSSAEIPQARTSAEWIRGWRDHLGYAMIRSGMQTSEDPDSDLIDWNKNSETSGQTTAAYQS